MRTKTINLRRGAFGQPSVPFLLSRRAHLLTTRKAGGGIPPVGRAVRSSRSAFQRFSRGGRQCRRRASPVQPASCFAPSAKNNVGGISPPPSRRLPAKICHRQFYRSYGYRFFCDTRFLFAKKNKNRNEVTVRTNGDLPLGSKGGQQRFGALCSCRFRLSELFKNFERL